MKLLFKHSPNNGSAVEQVKKDLRSAGIKFKSVELTDPEYLPDGSVLYGVIVET